MAATEDVDLGPIDVIVIGYPPGAPKTGEAIPILLDLVDRGIVRVFDARFVQKNEDGSHSTNDFTDLDPELAGDLKEFEGASTGLISDQDVALVAENMDPGMVAVIILYENHWAAPFANAVRRNGGMLLGDARIHVQDLIDSLEAAEAAV